MSISDQAAGQAAGIGALADATRRTLYEHVIAQPDAVTRESAAEALGVPLHVARFQLDRLVELGLLETEFRRLTGRSGPGAGRPSKLYRRAARTIAVSLPERRFDLAGHLLAQAIERSADGTPIEAAVRDVARTEGDAYGAMLRETADGAGRDGAADPPAGPDQDSVDAPADRAPGSAAPGDDTQHEFDRIGEALSSQGYEPRAAGGRIVLANCPFHDLARAHTDLICSMNQAYISGVADGLGCHHLEAELDPDAARCCVVIRAEVGEHTPVR